MQLENCELQVVVVDLDTISEEIEVTGETSDKGFYELGEVWRIGDFQSALNDDEVNLSNSLVRFMLYNSESGEVVSLKYRQVLKVDKGNIEQV